MLLLAIVFSLEHWTRAASQGIWLPLVEVFIFPKWWPSTRGPVCIRWQIWRRHLAALLDPQCRLQEISGGAFDSSLTARRVSGGAFVSTPIAQRVSGDWRRYYDVLVAYYIKNIEELKKQRRLRRHFTISFAWLRWLADYYQKTALYIDQKILIILTLFIRHFNYY